MSVIRQYTFYCCNRISIVIFYLIKKKNLFYKILSVVKPQCPSTGTSMSVCRMYWRQYKAVDSLSKCSFVDLLSLLVARGGWRGARRQGILLSNNVTLMLGTRASFLARYTPYGLFRGPVSARLRSGLRPIWSTKLLARYTASLGHGKFGDTSVKGNQSDV